jgi:hypothetical protein
MTGRTCAVSLRWRLRRWGRQPGAEGEGLPGSEGFQEGRFEAGAWGAADQVTGFGDRRGRDDQRSACTGQPADAGCVVGVVAVSERIETPVWVAVQQGAQRECGERGQLGGTPPHDNRTAPSRRIAASAPQIGSDSRVWLLHGALPPSALSVRCHGYTSRDREPVPGSCNA